MGDQGTPPISFLPATVTARLDGRHAASRPSVVELVPADGYPTGGLSSEAEGDGESNRGPDLDSSHRQVTLVLTSRMEREKKQNAG